LALNLDHRDRVVGTHSGIRRIWYGWSGDPNEKASDAVVARTIELLTGRRARRRYMCARYPGLSSAYRLQHALKREAIALIAAGLRCRDLARW